VKPVGSLNKRIHHGGCDMIKHWRKRATQKAGAKLIFQRQFHSTGVVAQSNEPPGSLKFLERPVLQLHGDGFRAHVAIDRGK
jgi:hypothetical protein